MVKNSNKNYLFLNIMISLFIVIIFLSFNIINVNYKELFYKQSVSIKLGEELPIISDYVDEENLKKLDSKKIIWNDLKLENNNLLPVGEYSGYISYRNKKITLKLVVVDDIAPIIDGVKDITIFVGDKVDLIKNIKVTDNSGDELDIKIEGNYDINKSGEYNLSYLAVDNSGNKTKEDFKLIVREKVRPNTFNKEEVVGNTSKGYEIKKINNIYYIDGILIANKSYSLPKSYAPGGLLSIFNNNFNNMKKDASNSSISLNVISGYRSYIRQSSIYNNYVNKDGKVKADTYSARPGHSEHQTGLAADINSLSTSFINTKEGKWLNDNCYKYGFIIRYPKGKESITGYMYEPWHIRYVGVELATKLYNSGNWISLEEHFGITSKY